MRYPALARHLEGQSTEDLRSYFLSLSGRKGKKTKLTRGLISRILKERGINGHAANDNIRITPPDINPENAKPGDTVKTFPDGTRIVKGDKDDWLYLKKGFVVKWKWETAEEFRQALADSYEEAVDIALGNPESNKDDANEEEVFDENDPFSPDVDLKHAKRGEIVKKISGGFEIVRGDKNNWNYLSEFVIRCPGGRMDRMADSYGEALRVVRELQEYGEYIKW